MRPPMWVVENAAVLAALVWTAALADLPHTPKTCGWMLGVFAAHTLRSHSGRLAEAKGEMLDLTKEFGTWMGALAVVLGADASARVLVGVPLVLQGAFTLWRRWYRARRQKGTP